MNNITEKSSSASYKAQGSLGDYIAIARLDHVTKQIFIVPGLVLAYLLRGIRTEHLVLAIVLGVITAVCVASANYVINEWLDRDFDRYHPEKSKRASVQRELQPLYVWAEWGLLITVGLISALLNSKIMLLVGILFAIQGVIYNVPPMRTKDKAYLDVISESVNNPLRLMIGWAMVDPTSLPPSSIILAYWTGGAFLMAAKRLSEYRQLSASHGTDVLVRYRASFGSYSYHSLLISCFVYALLAIFFLGVFLIKYRVEYLILVPIIIALFATYLNLSFEEDSSAQKPELLYREHRLIGLLILLTIGFAVTSAVNLPLLESLAGQLFIEIK